MLNFTFQNPTHIHFGEGKIEVIAQEIPKNARVLMVYGGGSIKSNGVYQQVIDALGEHTFFEFSGIEPNPTYDTLMKAQEIIKRENIDYLLAVGGGSVVDGAKFIAAAPRRPTFAWVGPGSFIVLANGLLMRRRLRVKRRLKRTFAVLSQHSSTCSTPFSQKIRI